MRVLTPFMRNTHKKSKKIGRGSLKSKYVGANNSQEHYTQYLHLESLITSREISKKTCLTPSCERNVTIS